MDIHVIIDTNFVFSLIISVEASRILRQRAFPRYGHRQKQCVEPWGIKSLSDILSGRNHYDIFIVRHILQSGHLFTLLFLLVAADKQKNIFDFIRQTTGKQCSVFLSFGQQDWRTPLLNQIQGRL